MGPYTAAEAKNQIVRWCRDGDANAFRRFYRANVGRLWKFLLARGCDSETAYDLVAEAFLRFIQTVCRNPSAPVALLYRIAINLRIDHYRRSKIVPEDAVAEPGELDVAATCESDDYGHIRELVKKLPEAEQNLLLLRYWIGLSHKEVAQVLGMPEGTVRRRCTEALESLRTRWNDDESRYGTG